MPAPSNTSFATATDLSPLPNTITQQVDFGGLTYTVFFKYLAQANDTIVGVFAYGDATVYIPETVVYAQDQVTIIVDNGGGDENKAVQFPVTAGQTYYIKVVPNAGNPTPANLSINAQLIPKTTVPVRSIFVNDDAQKYGIFLNSTTGAVLAGIAPFPHGEYGCIIPGGKMLFEDNSVSPSKVQVVNSDFSLGSLITTGFGTGLCHIRSNQASSRFYIAVDRNPPVLKYVDSTGALGGTSWTLGGVSFLNCIAVNQADSKCYYNAGQAIKAWDLTNNIALPDFYAGDSTYFVCDMLVLDDDSLVACFLRLSDGDTYVKRFSSAGALLNTYTIGTTHLVGSTRPRLAYDTTTSNSFWVWWHDNVTVGQSNFKCIKASDGSTLLSCSSVEFESDIYNETVTATPAARFGNSLSCPFVITRNSFTPAGGGGGAVTGTVIVIKRTDVVTTQVFAFTASAGLVPGTFNLTKDGQETFNSVTVGSGYSIVETAPPNFAVSYQVSTGESNTNFSVSAGQTTTIIVTNTFTPGANGGKLSGMYKIDPNSYKTNDTVWTDEVNGYTATVKIPDPSATHPLIGD